MSNTPKFEAWAVFEPKGQVKPFSYEPRELSESDVEVRISHCGICATDIHQIDSGWGPSIYPLVPGHEIVGHVIKKGSKVTNLVEGDRVGIGFQVLSCGSCSDCLDHLEQYCTAHTPTYNSRYPDGKVAYGGFQKKIRVNSKFAIKIPANIPSENAAPLLCAGVTTYEPLRRFNVGPGNKLGVVGIGGLGHLGIQWGVALGADVTAISRSERKRDLSIKLGAKEFLNFSDEIQAKKAIRTFDFLLQTESVTSNYTDYIKLLKPRGVLILVAVPDDKLIIDGFPLLVNGCSISGSVIGSPSRIKEMLNLASEKNVKAMTQVFPISQVNEALQGARDGKPTFRYVLEIQPEAHSKL